MKKENEATRIELKFPDGLSLSWRVFEHEAANIWLKNLLLNLKLPHLIKNRFLGFSNSKRDENFLSEKLNNCIEVINTISNYAIEERFKTRDSQEVLNSIHHHFSVLIGKEGEGSSLWRSSCSKMKSAICGLNDYVHEIESWRKAGQGSGAYCCVEFFEADGMEIPKRWDELFSLDLNFGDITLHYDQIGKTWLEVLIDEDESIIDEAIRPLSRVTGSFNVNLFEVKAKEIKEKVEKRAKKLDINLEDPSLRLGQIKVASLEIDKSSMNKKEIVDAIGLSQKVESIRIMRGDKLLITKKLGENLERYFDMVEWK